MAEMWKPAPTEVMKSAFITAHNHFPEGGLCLEFGVGSGNSFCYQALQILNFPYAKNSNVIGFDSFQGLPEETEGVWAPERHSKGRFAYPVSEVHDHMGNLGIPIGDPRFCLVEGFFEDTLTIPLQTRLRASYNLIFVNIDVDIHSSTIQALDWIRKMLRPGVVIYFDDWLDPIDIGKGATKWGEHLAWEQWSEANGVKAVLGSTNELNQRYLIVTEC